MLTRDGWTERNECHRHTVTSLNPAFLPPALETNSIATERHHRCPMTAKTSAKLFLKSLHIVETFQAYGLFLDGSEAILFCGTTGSVNFQLSFDSVISITGSSHTVVLLWLLNDKYRSLRQPVTRMASLMLPHTS